MNNIIYNIAKEALEASQFHEYDCEQWIQNEFFEELANERLEQKEILEVALRKILTILEED